MKAITLALLLTATTSAADAIPNASAARRGHLTLTCSLLMIFSSSRRGWVRDTIVVRPRCAHRGRHHSRGPAPWDAPIAASHDAHAGAGRKD